MEGEGNKNLVGVESTGGKIGGGGMSKFLSGGWRIPSNPPPVGKTLILGPWVATKPGNFNSPEPLPLLA